MIKPTTQIFSKLEQQTLYFLCQGLTAKESAAKLHLNPHNIEDILKGVKKRLGISKANSPRLVAFIFENELNKYFY